MQSAIALRMTPTLLLRTLLMRTSVPGFDRSPLGDLGDILDPRRATR